MKAGLLRHALWPWWVLQLATGAKSFVDNPLIGSRRLNEAGLHIARLKLAHRMAWARRRRLAHLIDPADQAIFYRDGFIVKNPFLPEEAFLRLRQQLGHYHGSAREMVQGDAITRRIALDPAALKAMPDVKALLSSPAWRGLTRYVGSFDSEPVWYIQTILAQQVAGPEDPQLSLHADTFHPTVKAWLFLNDVAEEDGPLTYVRGSHLLTPERLSWERCTSFEARSQERLTARGSFRITADELPSLGLSPPIKFAVPANTLVVADTSGFHARGRASRASERAEIWGYSRRNPFLPWTGFDLLSLPGIAERRVPIYWRFRDRYARWIGQPWQEVGIRQAFDASVHLEPETSERGEIY